MPTFEQSTIVEMDLTPEEFYDECTKEEVEELVELIKEDFPEMFSLQPNNLHAAESEFELMINALHGKWNMLTTEEEESIRNVAKKFL